MKPIAIKYSLNKSIYLIIFSFMFIVFASILGLVFLLGQFQLNNTFELIALFSVIILLVVLLIYIILKMLKSKGEISFNQNSISIQLEKASFFYKETSMEIPFSNIKNIALDEDYYNRKVISIETNTPSELKLIEPESQDNTEAFDLFWQNLDVAIQGYNKLSLSDNSIIKQESMYNKWWIKALAIVCGILSILAIFAKIYDSAIVPTWRVILLLIYTVPFCILVYKNSKKK
ncbi:MAG: hypothetical protein KDD21_07060 [Bacteroidetes bacterium]|nr:hypothetical protein [Bacteroidota bacterium]